MASPRINDVNTLIQCGFDPKTGLPIKMGCAIDELKLNIKKQLRIIDEQDAIRSFVWYNLPSGLTGEIIERILYYRGKGTFFYMPTNGTFYFLPYALDGSIDPYGRYIDVAPLAFNGTSSGKDKEKPWIQGLTRKVIYEFPAATSLELMDKGCVILSDYCKQISQENISRQLLNDPLLDIEADCIPFMRTALLNSTGIEAMRVNGQDEYSNVEAANRSLYAAALKGERMVPVVGAIDFQPLTTGATGKAEEFMLAMQSLDNFRLGTHGLDNGGLFEKKAHELQAENAMNAQKVGRTFQDRLTQRQDFCDMVNAIWGLGIYCEPAENVVGDLNMDGFGFNKQDQSGMAEGTQPEAPVQEEEVVEE